MVILTGFKSFSETNKMFRIGFSNAGNANAMCTKLFEIRHEQICTLKCYVFFCKHNYLFRSWGMKGFCECLGVGRVKECKSLKKKCNFYSESGYFTEKWNILQRKCGNQQNVCVWVKYASMCMGFYYSRFQAGCILTSSFPKILFLFWRFIRTKGHWSHTR